MSLQFSIFVALTDILIRQRLRVLRKRRVRRDKENHNINLEYNSESNRECYSQKCSRSG